ncbi:MAG: BrnA antitoxin family protein [Burkholderiales bacterium]
MTARKRASRRSLGSDLKRVDAHVIQRHEYDELPELTDEMLARGKVNKGGRPRSANPRKLISIRLPESVIERWRATGPGWQTRMADRLAKAQPK